jgi:hexulose-6-phosphate isomerase
MQGRLLPPQQGCFQCFPRENWRDEFAYASQAGLDAIEWIYDLQGADVNPLATDEGVAELLALSQRNGVVVASVCADYFMDRPFATANPTEFAELSAHLLWLLGRCRTAGIERIVLPFVDASRIQSPSQQEAIITMLREVLPHAARQAVEIHLETDLGPHDFTALLAQLPHPFLKVNYDSGNSASLGYDPRLETSAYGFRIGSVHIKDRVRGGGTVPLGTGDAQIPALLQSLSALSYTGDFVLQVARGAAGDEVAWARQNLAYLTRELAATRSSA